MNTIFYPELVLVEQNARKFAETEAILERLPDVELKYIPSLDEFLLNPAKSTPKKTLILAEQKGDFLKPCPGTQKYICCNYYFLNLATNCDVGCTYCILQGYLNNPFMTVYTNLEKMFAEVRAKLQKHNSRFFRIGTGELTDSLTLDPITQYSRKLIPFFLEQKNAILELKTKTTRIEHLLHFKVQRRVIVSWSLNPDEIIATEEPNAPSLKERLIAAQKCAEKEYLIGFHFDPMIYYPNWESGYREVVEQLIQHVPADQIVWVSLGALRYPAEMDPIIRQNHPESRIYLAELFPGKDGKLRYFRPIREKMFRSMVSWFKELAPQVTVYLCMESADVWKAAFASQPLRGCGLPRRLDNAVVNCAPGPFSLH